MKKRGSVKQEIVKAKKAFRNWQKAAKPLFLRTAEDDHKAPATKAAAKALKEIAIEFADIGELEYHVGSINEIAKERGFKSWEHLLSFSQRDYAGLKQAIKDIPVKAH